MMSCGGNSGLTSGKQCSLEQESARIQVEKMSKSSRMSILRPYYLLLLH